MIHLQIPASFNKQLQKHASIKDDVARKVKKLLEHPLAGEPLKGNLRGYFSTPVKRNFILIYLYCAACRARHDQLTVACPDCQETPDQTLRLVFLGPHDHAYRALLEKTGH